MSEISEDRPDDPSVGDLLTRIDRHAVRFDGASARDLSGCSQTLEQAGSPALAADHMGLLKLTNGLLWNGVQLFGTAPIDRPQRRYTVPSIHEATVAAAPPLDPKTCLIIGRTEDEWLVMAQLPGRIAYQEVDCLGGDIYRQAASIRRLLTRIIKERTGGF
ncbi:MAG: hypothetical protein AAF213_03395 [Pseudomonadota bacterium]